MEFDEYQDQASTTDQHPLTGGEQENLASRAMLVPLLGLAGEVGELVTEYKKRLRDGESYGLFKARMAEELGDLLWYLTNVATKFGLSLGHIAAENLQKTGRRWEYQEPSNLLDDEFPPSERLPRRLNVRISVDASGMAVMNVGRQQLGARLTDNRYEDDGYRFHDVFHLAHMAILGWSPVMRALLGRKRRSDPRVDEIEDGGRAIVIEEGIAAVVFGYAENHGLLEGAAGVSSELLRTIKQATSHLEVSRKREGEWEQAILHGFRVWRAVKQNRGGRVLVDLNLRTIRLSN